jgi:hypothetical protein
MRWLVLVPYVALVGFVWASEGPWQALIVVGLVLFLTACFRPMVVGTVLTSWGRRLSRVDSDAGADHLPMVVRSGRSLVQLLSSRRERRDMLDSSAEEGDDLVVALDHHSAPRDSHRSPGHPRLR